MTPRNPDLPGRWAAQRALRPILERFRAGCGRVPAAAWRRWWVGLAVGYVLVGLLMAALIAAVRAAMAAGDLGWEMETLRWLAARPYFSFSSAVWVQTLGTDITLILVVLAGAGVAAWASLPLRTLSIVAAYLLTDLVVRAGWLAWDRPRPTLILDGIAAPGFASFPSGHTAKSLAVYGILAYFWGRSSTSRAERLLAFSITAGIATLVMAGRLRMGVHWPSDVGAGAAVGAGSLVALIAALRGAERAAASPPPESPRPATPPAPGAPRGNPPPGSTGSA